MWLAILLLCLETSTLYSAEQCCNSTQTPGSKVYFCTLLTQDQTTYFVSGVGFIKFRYSEKATQFWNKLTFFWHNLRFLDISWDISRFLFLDFLEITDLFQTVYSEEPDEQLNWAGYRCNGTKIFLIFHLKSYDDFWNLMTIPFFRRLKASASFSWIDNVAEIIMRFQNFFLSNCEGLHAFLSGKWGGSRKWWSTDPLSTQGGFSLCQVSNTAKAKLYVSSKSSCFFLIQHTPMHIKIDTIWRILFPEAALFLIVLMNKPNYEC